MDFVGAQSGIEIIVMEHLKVILLSGICLFTFISEMSGQNNKNNFVIGLLVGSKINNQDATKNSPKTLGTSVNLTYEKPNFSSTLTTSIHTGQCESYLQSVWSIGPAIRRKNFKIRSQIGIGMLFYTAKKSDDFLCSESQLNSFNTFCVTTSLDMEYYFSKRVGVIFNLAKNYNIDLPLAQVMGGVLFRFGAKQPPPIQFALN